MANKILVAILSLLAPKREKRKYAMIYKYWDDKSSSELWLWICAFDRAGRRDFGTREHAKIDCIFAGYWSE